MVNISTINWVFVCGLSFCLGGIAVLSLMPLGSGASAKHERLL